MLMPAWRRAMFSYPNLALRSGKPRPETCSPTPSCAASNCRRSIFGDTDVYGRPEVGERAASLMPDARLDVLPGRHAPFLDSGRCAALIRARP
jgi:hypothetical protein